MLTLRAPAKVNLVLEVLGKRADGYHEIRSILQAVDLCDTIELELSNSFTFDCNTETIAAPENLVVRAAKLLAETTGVRLGARIALKKRIPVGMGLGGGSSDAAACLLGLNHLWGLGMTVDRLGMIGSRIGSDVPFFIYGGACMVGGRGELVTPLPDQIPHWVVLMAPAVSGMPEKTKRMYQMLTDVDFSDGGKAEILRRRMMGGVEVVGPDMLFNAFERVARLVFPGLSETWHWFEMIAGQSVHLCGSGPALFSLHSVRAEAEMVVERLKSKGMGACAVSWLSRPSDILLGLR